MLEYLHDLGTVHGALFANILLWLSAWGSGRLVLIFILQDIHNIKLDPILVLPIGLTFIALLVLVSASSGLFAYVAPSFIILLPALTTVILEYVMFARQAFHIPLFSKNIRIINWIIGIPVFILLLGVGLGLPTGYDELVYHVTLPVRWLHSGRLSVYPDLPYSGFPAATELLYLPLLDAGGFIAPRLFSWSCWSLAIIGIFRYCNRKAGSAWGLSVAVALILSRVGTMIYMDSYVEGYVALQAICALTALGLGHPLRPNPDFRSFLLAGLAAGGAFAVKLNGIFLIPAVAAAGLALLGTRRPPLLRQFGLVFVVLLGAGCIAIPFYLRPWLLTGNPFYPYLASWFTSDTSILEMSEFHHATGAGRFGASGICMFLSAPVLLAWANDIFDGHFGWQLIILEIMAIIGLRNAFKSHRSEDRHSEPISLAFFTAILYMGWFASAQQARFAMPWILGVALLSTWGANVTKPTIRHGLCIIIVSLSLIMAPWERSGFFDYSWRFAIGKHQADDFVFINTGDSYLTAMDAIRILVPEEAPVLFLFENRTLYCPRKAQIGTPFFQPEWFTPPEEWTDCDKIMHKLKSNNMRFLMISRKSDNPDALPSWYKRNRPFLISLDTLRVEGKLSTIWEDKHNVLLKVLP